MFYEILETHCLYNNGKLIEIAVLWNDAESVRGTFVNLIENKGYLKNDIATPEVIQEVAAYGHYLDETRKKKYFPGKRNWSR